MTCVDGAVRLHDANGRAMRDLAHLNCLDARWLDDGRILALDNRGTQTWNRGGVLVDQRNISPRVGARPQTSAACLAGDGSRFVALTEREIFVAAIDGERVWRFNPSHVGRQDAVATRANLGNTGKLVAIGYDTGRIGRVNPRSWVVIDVDSQQIVDRIDLARTDDGAPTMFEFDRADKRGAHPGGVVRLGRGDNDRLLRSNGARAIALDDRGVIAVYGFSVAPSGAPGRLRIDYLAPDAKGPPEIDVVDTLWLDPDVATIAAIAFSADSHGLACLGGDGSVDVVPVP